MKFSLTEEAKYKLHETQKAAGYRSNRNVTHYQINALKARIGIVIFNAEGSFKIIQLYKFVLLSLTFDIIDINQILLI